MMRSIRCAYYSSKMFLTDAYKTVKSKNRMTQIICQRIPDRQGCDILKARQPALDSLWRGTMSSFWQTDRRCLREATSVTNVHNSERYRWAVAFKQANGSVKTTHKRVTTLSVGAVCACQMYCLFIIVTWRLMQMQRCLNTDRKNKSLTCWVHPVDVHFKERSWIYQTARWHLKAWIPRTDFRR